MDALVRLNKFIASNGFSSRRKIDEMIEQARVTVNGNTITELGFKIDPAIDKVALDGEVIRTSKKKIYIIINKPAGVITSVSDEKNRTTVVDLIKLKEKIFPVGRLDYNTTGLLLLTNDGELANKLMHPKGEVFKTYFVKLSKPLEEKHRIKLSEGVKIEGNITAPAKIRFASKNNFEDLYISIFEGRNRQVRNMFEYYGYFVRELERVEYAGLKLGTLKEGEWRLLTPEEVAKLYEKVKDVSSRDINTSTGRKSFGKKAFKKYGVHGNREKGNVKKSFNRFDKRDDFQNSRTDKKKDTKWGFKKRQTEEKEKKLGFGKFESRHDRGDSKRKFNKFDTRDEGREGNRAFKKFDRREYGQNENRGFNSYGKRNYGKDEKKKFGKFEKRYNKNEISDFNKSEKRYNKNEISDFKKFDKRNDRKDFRKIGKANNKSRAKGNFVRFDMRDANIKGKKPNKE